MNGTLRPFKLSLIRGQAIVNVDVTVPYGGWPHHNSNHILICRLAGVNHMGSRSIHGAVRVYKEMGDKKVCY